VLGSSVADTLHWAINLAEETQQSSSSKFQTEGLGSSRTKVTTPNMTSYSATEAFNEDEREFLASILPVRVAAVTSDSYGSFPDLGDVSSESMTSPDSYRTGTDTSRTGMGNSWSTDSSCVDASGAFTYYLACSRSPETKRLKGDRDSPRKSPGSHHRRALRGNGTGPVETRTVPFSLAVEEIGSSAQVTVRTVGITCVNSLQLHTCRSVIVTMVFHALMFSQLPECLQASLYGLHTFHSYKTAVRANIMTGGDNVCRSWLIGKCSL
jgi:hypothetical protein